MIIFWNSSEWLSTGSTGVSLVLSGSSGDSVPPFEGATTFKPILKVNDQIIQSIILSILIRKRKRLNEDFDINSDRQGNWFDSVDEISYGCSIWELETEPLIDETLFLFQTYIEESLQWLIDEAVISSLSVTVERKDINRLACSISFKKPDGSSAEVNLLWDKLHENTVEIGVF